MNAAGSSGVYARGVARGDQYHRPCWRRCSCPPCSRAPRPHAGRSARTTCTRSAWHISLFVAKFQGSAGAIDEGQRLDDDAVAVHGGKQAGMYRCPNDRELGQGLDLSGYYYHAYASRVSPKRPFDGSAAYSAKWEIDGPFVCDERTHYAGMTVPPGRGGQRELPLMTPPRGLRVLGRFRVPLRRGRQLLRGHLLRCRPQFAGRTARPAAGSNNGPRATAP